MDCLCHVSFIEWLYADILLLHADHNKRLALVEKVKVRHCNVSRDWDIFTRMCPGCIERGPKPKPLAGLRTHVITLGLVVHGQCDLIDLQSMAYGMFKYLLNYINHGVKFLFAIPLVANYASCIALPL